MSMIWDPVAKMLFAYGCFLPGIPLLESCNKEERDPQHHNPSPRLLVSIKKEGHVLAEFIYDSLNLLIQKNNYSADTITDSEFYFYDNFNRLTKPKKLFRVFSHGRAINPASAGGVNPAKPLVRPAPHDS